MIKAGQIYEDNKGKYVITFVFSEENYNAVTSQGFVFCSNELPTGVLVTEYPTWQEAINSKEFKND